MICNPRDPSTDHARRENVLLHNSQISYHFLRWDVLQMNDGLRTHRRRYPGRFAVWTQNVLLGAVVVWRNVIRKMDKKRTTLNETWYGQENVSNPTPNTSPYRSESHCRNIGSMKSLYTSSAPPSLGIMSQTRKTSAPSQWILTIFLGPDSFGRELNFNSLQTVRLRLL